MKTKAEKTLDELFGWSTDYSRAQCIKAIESSQQQPSMNKIIKAIGNNTEYIDGKHYRHEYRKLSIAVIEFNELCKLLSEISEGEDKQQPSISSMGDYKCHVETNVKDSKGKPVFVDKCLKEAIELLNEHGIKTIASCCGHCKVSPTILIEQPQAEQDDNRKLAKGILNENLQLGDTDDVSFGLWKDSIVECMFEYHKKQSTPSEQKPTDELEKNGFSFETGI